MSYQLILFPTPLDATCEVRTDHGVTAPGHSATHHTGRLGQGFDFPDDAPNGQGARFTMKVGSRLVYDVRGILYFRQPGFPYPWTDGQTAAFVVDDFVALASASLPPLVRTGQFLAQAIG